MIDKSTDINEEILNTAFKLGLEFGENWLVPVAKRLKKRYPALSKNSIKLIDEQINYMRVYSLELISDCINGSRNEAEAFSKLDICQEKITQQLRDESPMLKNDVIDRIYSQAIYYSRK